jgi:FkbM family methyltransferase
MKQLTKMKAVIHESALGFEARLLFRKVFSNAGLAKLDKKMMKYLPVGEGIYIEAGANDGINQSNTYFLERKHGWTGILVEPVPRLYERCQRARPKSLVINAALVGPENEGENITILDLGLMSVVDGALGGGEQEEKHIEYGKSFSGKKFKKSVAVGITISNLIDGYGPNQISLLSLDLEGYEIEALKGLDLGRHQPSCILLETKQIDEVIKILGYQYDLLEKITHHDYVFGLRDRVML